jgi:hypothetical protein
MSLSFVASAVLTTTADGTFEETKIESKQADAINKRNSHKPLFQQLRQNQEEEEAKQEDAQRQMMRGTMALDDEDVAHLDAIDKQRLERERAVQDRMQDELLQFRAARAERQQGVLEDEEVEDDEVEDSLVGDGKGPSSGVTGIASVTPQQTVETTQKHKPVFPKIVVKKRKRKTDSSAKDKSLANEKSTIKKKREEPTNETQENNVDDGKPETKTQATPPAAGLGGLLSGYGSSDDDSDQ